MGEVPQCPYCGKKVSESLGSERQTYGRQTDGASTTISLPRPYGHRPQSGDPGRLSPDESPSKGRSSSNLTLALVAVCCVVSLVVFYIFVIAPVPEIGPPERLVIGMTSPTVEQRSIDGQVRWDTILNINWMSPNDARPSWIDVRVVIRSSDGIILESQRAPQEDLGLYDDAVDGAIDVEFWFIDRGSRDSFVAVGDAIRITGMTEEYQEATVEIVYAGERIGSIGLPWNFS